jgi:transposase, IS6 family
MRRGPAGVLPGDQWLAGETYAKVAGRRTYPYRAADQHGPVIDVLLPRRRDLMSVSWCGP